jgi:hypothetical protein
MDGWKVSLKQSLLLVQIMGDIRESITSALTTELGPNEQHLKSYLQPVDFYRGTDIHLEYLLLQPSGLKVAQFRRTGVVRFKTPLSGEELLLSTDSSPRE